jgi:hypothetical protein
VCDQLTIDDGAIVYRPSSIVATRKRLPLMGTSGSPQ